MNGESSRPLAVREFLAFSLSETRDVGRRRNMRLLRRASTPRGSSHPLKFYLLNYKSVHVWSPAQRENAQPWTCWLLFPNMERQSRASPVENNQRTRGICGQEIPKHGNVYDTRKSKYFPVNSHCFFFSTTSTATHEPNLFTSRRSYEYGNVQQNGNAERPTALKTGQNYRCVCYR